MPIDKVTGAGIVGVALGVAIVSLVIYKAVTKPKPKPQPQLRRRTTLLLF